MHQHGDQARKCHGKILKILKFCQNQRLWPVLVLITEDSLPCSVALLSYLYARGQEIASSDHSIRKWSGRWR